MRSDDIGRVCECGRAGKGVGNTAVAAARKIAGSTPSPVCSFNRDLILQPIKSSPVLCDIKYVGSAIGGPSLCPEIETSIISVKITA